jgi:murein DD-endopeptidase MepM/ murein hydrolase activator NlpD
VKGITVSMKRFISLTLLICLLLGITLISYGATSVTEAKKQKASVDSKLNDVKNQKSVIKNKIANAADQKDSMLKEKEKVELEKRKKERELAALEKEIGNIDVSINDAACDYAEKKELLQKRLTKMYQNSKKSILEVLIESESVIEFFERMEVISLIAKKDKELMNAVYNAKKDLEYKKNLKVSEKVSKTKQTAAIKSNIRELSFEVSRAEDKISIYNRELKQLEDREDQLIKESKKLASDIYSLQKQGTRYVEGKMRWPLRGYSHITSSFGNRYHPILHKYKQHTGIDIGAPKGVSILAANKGTVIVAGWQNGYGNTVVIDHGGGISTLYAHCSRITVSKGDNVYAGEVIAKVGSTGYSTGYHLHFEIRVKGNPINPLSYYR